MGILASAAPILVGQGVWDSQEVRNWAWDQVKSWKFNPKDPQGNTLWVHKGFFELSNEEQTGQLLDRLSGSPKERRAALLVLGQRPPATWVERALNRPDARDEVALWSFRHGFTRAGQDPYGFLEPGARLERPWTQGLGLHLDGAGWRFQWIPSPVLLPKARSGAGLPAALDRAPVPTAILHFRQLRAGLLRIQDLAGGDGGMVGALAQGSRAGFLLRHLGPWLKQAPPGLEGLAQREAWVLHFGTERGFAPAAGTLVFLPGNLPAGATALLALLKLNPSSSGARSRTLAWEDGRGNRASVTQVRGAGGVLHVLSAAGGTWISDREEPLRSVAFPTPFPTLGERREWGRVAVAACHPGTDVSLWILPRLGAGAAFERACLRRQNKGLDQPTWPNPGMAKAAPRAGAVSAALGAGPTEVLVRALLRQDQDGLPVVPDLPSGPLQATPDQVREHAAEVAAMERRRAARSALARDLAGLEGLLDLRGAAFLWNGWVAPVPLTEAQRATLADFRALRKTDPTQAGHLLRQRKIDVYGGFLEPGMCPALAVALPVQAGRRVQAEAQLARIWSRLFKGAHQGREYARGVTIHRIATAQAFLPSYAFVDNTLVLATDDASAQAMVAGLLGQAPTLADTPSGAFGRVEVDGAAAARDLELLLTAYLRASRENRYAWLGEPGPTDDEASAEVASTFGPFLGALKALGRRRLDLALTEGGFEAGLVP